MNSNQVQQYQEQASRFGGAEFGSVNLLAKSVASYLDALGFVQKLVNQFGCGRMV